MNIRLFLAMLALTIVTASCSDEISAPNPEPVPVDEVLTLITESKQSYESLGFDTVWVKVNPVSLISTAKVTYSVKITEKYSEDVNGDIWDFVFPEEGADIVYGRDFFDKPHYLSDNQPRTDMMDWVGVVYRAPRGVGKAVLTVAVDDGKNVSTVDAEIVIAPKAHVYLVYSVNDYYHDGEPVSHPVEVVTATVDINTVIKCRASVYSIFEKDFDAAIEAYKAGLYKWEINGDCIEVKSEEHDIENNSQYSNPRLLIYLTLESSEKEGVADISFSTLNYTRRSKLKVENFDVVRPIERIIIREFSNSGYDGTLIEHNDLDERTFVMGETDNSTLEVILLPYENNEYYDIEVVSSDPSIIDVAPNGYGGGYTRKFIARKPGQAVITATARNKSKTMMAYVVDKVLSINLNDAPAKFMKGDVVEVSANVRMSSGSDEWIPQCEFTVSDPSIVSVENIAGKPNAVRLTALATGEITLTATADGVSSEPVSIMVIDSVNGTISDADVSEAVLTFDGDVAGIYITSKDSQTDYDLLVVEDIARDDIYGDYNYNDMNLTVKGVKYDAARIAITVTADTADADYAFINGSVTMTNGAVLCLSNIRAIIEL